MVFEPFSPNPEKPSWKVSFLTQKPLFDPLFYLPHRLFGVKTPNSCQKGTFWGGKTTSFRVDFTAKTLFKHPSQNVKDDVFSSVFGVFYSILTPKNSIWGMDHKLNFLNSVTVPLVSREKAPVLRAGP